MMIFQVFKLPSYSEVIQAWCTAGHVDRALDHLRVAIATSGINKPGFSVQPVLLAFIMCAMAPMGMRMPQTWFPSKSTM